MAGKRRYVLGEGIVFIHRNMTSRVFDMPGRAYLFCENKMKPGNYRLILERIPSKRKEKS